MQYRNRGNSWQYLVRWLHYGPKHNEWVHEVELAKGAGVILKLYKDGHGLH